MANQSNDAAQIDTRVLDSLYKAMKDNKIVARVGILGTHAVRKDGKSNAVIGAAHEYGAPARNLPMRYFLRMPLTEFLPKEVAKSDQFTEDMFKKVIQENSLRPYVKKLARLGEAVVAEAFNTGGFGKWKALNPKTLSQKVIKQILVETQQLRDSITSEVK